jgi:tetratricopeptide (TPR) repeat protein
MSILARSVLILGLLLPVCSGGSADPASLLPSEVLALEKAGQLEGALTLLAPRALAQDPEAKGDLGAHAGLLRETIRTLHLSSVYHEDGHDERAQAALEALLGKLEPLRDGHLVVAAARRLREIQKEVREEEEKEAREQLATAAALLDAEKFDEALAAYDEVARRAAGQVPRALIHEARVGKMKVTSAKARATAPGFWNAVSTSGVTGARTVAEWVVYFASAGLLVLLIAGVRSRIPARPGTVVSLQDLTAPGADREPRSQHLVREFLQRIQGAADGGLSAAHVDAFDDLDGVGLGNLRIQVDPLAEAQTFLHEDAVRIGPFSLKPRQLLSFLGSLLQRSSESVLRGSLTSEGDQVLMNVEHVILKGSRLHPGCWELVERGEGARARVVQRMAMRIAFELASSRLTSDWESFDLYRKAMEKLAREEEEEERERHLEDAWNLLRSSLYHDPANWLARFNLATVERKLGRREAAADHFEFLDRMLAEHGRSQPLSDFLRRHPEFVYTVQYNWAVCLSKIENNRSRSLALAILDDLIANVTESPIAPEEPAAAAVTLPHPLAPRTPLSPGGSQRLRIEMLARSARASALLGELEKDEKENRGPWFEKIKIEKNWFESLGLDRQDLDWRAYALSYAVAQNAFGRACFRFGFYDLAVEVLRRAIIMSPDFGDAYNNLAEIYLKRRRRQDPDWANKVEVTLQQALRINGSNQKSHYLLGRFYSLPAIGRFNEAKEHLGKASLLSWSYFYIAEILVREKSHEKALKVLRRSIFTDQFPDRRYVIFVETALDVSQRRGGDRVLLEEALLLARKYAESGEKEKPREKEFRQKLLRKVQDALAAPPPVASRKKAPAAVSPPRGTPPDGASGGDGTTEDPSPGGEGEDETGQR